MFTIGCDPEFFLKQRNTGKLISAIPYVDGTKHDPKPLPKGGNIQRDNVAVEVATDPADSIDKFVNSIRNILADAVSVLPADTEIVAIPSASFDKKELEHPEAQAFGCDPDYCAWEKRENDRPYTADMTFRSCGAHIHVGTTGEDENAFLLEFPGKIAMARTMDCIHGVISTILDNSEESIARRRLYGKPGAHRPKEYGIEYRVLSNYWLKSPVTVMLMHSLTQDALAVVRDGKSDALIEAMGEHEVRNTILKGDVAAARKMVNRHLTNVLSEQSLHYFNEALAKVEANDMDFHKEWELYK